jgi:2-C-methyl-D-erythritol 2,4-cyclodiphosphate synthase
MTQRSPVARVGWGYDVHALNDEPPLTLGGVVVSHTQGVAATSDGDVLAHAITDALLGACVLGDVGQHFPSDDPVFEDADSMFLLRQAATMVMAKGFRPEHVDSTVVVENIRIAPHRDVIRDNLADALGIGVESVSLKATTTDGLGFVGRDEGIAAIAVVTVVPLT